jgi:hypothetical protein
MLGGDPLPKEELVVEENVNFKRPTSVGAVSADDDTVSASNLPPPQEEAKHPGTLQQAALTFDPSPPLKEAKEYSIEAPDNQAELMHWHYCLGHLTFKKLQQLARHGEIYERLVNVHAPRCAGYLFGAMTKVLWSNKKAQGQVHTVFVATKPGECVSVDHLISTEPGFFGQAKRTITKTGYKNATIFVNRYSRLILLYLMTSNLNSLETIEAKQAFERFAAQHGIRIQHYHCDNGQFANNNFKMVCEQSNQQLTFCGVNAHFQNRIAEKAIQDLSESARKQLLHAR